MQRLDRNDILTVVANTVIGSVVGGAYTQIAYLNEPDAQGSLWLGFGIGATIGLLASLSDCQGWNRDRPN